MASRPLSAKTLLALFESALLISTAAFFFCFLLAWALHAAIARVERADGLAVTLRTSAAAVWFAPAIILMASLSPLFLPAALLLVVNATRVLYQQWRRQNTESPAPPSPYEYLWFGGGEAAGPVLPRHFGPALAVSFGLQAGAAALILQHHLLAAACFAIAASICTVFALSAGLWKTARPATLPRSIFGAGLTIVLSAMLIVAGVAGGSGGFGFGFGSGGNSIAGWKKRPSREPGDAAKARPRPKDLPPLPPDRPNLDGSFPGVILWPEVKPVTMLVAPLPSSPGAFAAGGHSLSIPFAGEYWFFRFLYKRPPPGSYYRRGNPADSAFSTTDRWPLEMEAHQVLPQDIDLACCSLVQVDIRNADRIPNTVSLELFVIGDSTVSLGTQPVRTTPNLLVTPVQPVAETLSFQVPPVASLVFREFKVVFHRFKTRQDKSARVAIQRFILQPRGAVVADPM